MDPRLALARPEKPVYRQHRVGVAVDRAIAMVVDVPHLDRGVPVDAEQAGGQRPADAWQYPGKAAPAMLGIDHQAAAMADLAADDRHVARQDQFLLVQMADLRVPHRHRLHQAREIRRLEHAVRDAGDRAALLVGQFDPERGGRIQVVGLLGIEGRVQPVIALHLQHRLAPFLHVLADGELHAAFLHDAGEQDDEPLGVVERRGRGLRNLDAGLKTRLHCLDHTDSPGKTTRTTKIGRVINGRCTSITRY